MDRETAPLKQFISAHAEAPSLVVLGKSPQRMDAVIGMFREFGGIDVHGSFTEVEALELIAATPRLRAVAIGGAIEEAARLRIRAELERNHPGVQTSEPGHQYPSTDENIVRDVLAKLGLHEVWHGVRSEDVATLAAIRAQSAPFKGAMSGPEARPGYDAMIEAAPAAPDVTYEDGVVGGVSGVWCRPKAAKANAAIMFLHGGAYVLGSAKAYRHFAGHFAARTGVATFVPDYGLGPERPFPAGLGDVHAVFKALATTHGRLAIVGDSAGGGLALALLALVQAESGAGLGTPAAACVVMSPWTDLALTGSSFTTRADEDPFVTREMLAATAAMYLGEASATDPLASPIYGALEGLAPTQIHVGTSEVLFDDTLTYAQRARQRGGEVEAHVWQGMPHVFPSNLGALAAADHAMDFMAAFLVERLKI